MRAGDPFGTRRLGSAASIWAAMLPVPAMDAGQVLASGRGAAALAGAVNEAPPRAVLVLVSITAPDLVPALARRSASYRWAR